MFDFEFFASGSITLNNVIEILIHIYFIGLGDVCLSGHALENLELIYYSKFQPGDIAYDCEEAIQNGKLIKVFIRDIALIFSPKIGPSAPDKMYTDIYNGTWMERMLCTEKEAVDQATLYWSRILNEATALNNALNPSCRTI